MLTAHDLAIAEPGEILAYGVVLDSPRGVNLTRSGRPLLWVAVRGGIPDWAMYVHFADGLGFTGHREVSWSPATFAPSNLEAIRRFGDKLRKEHAVRLLPCDAEAAERYRP